MNLTHLLQSQLQPLIQKHQSPERAAPITVASCDDLIDGQLVLINSRVGALAWHTDHIQAETYVDRVNLGAFSPQFTSGIHIAELQPTRNAKCQAGPFATKAHSILGSIDESWGRNVFDVYRIGARDLLVLKIGSPIPPAYSGKRWRKSRRRILKVSEEIKSAVQQQGYYVRSLRSKHGALIE